MITYEFDTLLCDHYYYFFKPFKSHCLIYKEDYPIFLGNFYLQNLYLRFFIGNHLH